MIARPVPTGCALALVAACGASPPPRAEPLVLAAQPQADASDASAREASPATAPVDASPPVFAERDAAAEAAVESEGDAYEVDALTLLATLSSGGTWKALAREPSDLGRVLREGDVVGPAACRYRVAKIRTGAVSFAAVERSACPQKPATYVLGLRK